MMRRVFWLIPLAAAACGYTDAGSGTKTLHVTARADYTVGNGNRTEVVVTVADRNGTAVTTAAVDVRDGDSGESFVLQHETAETYRASITDYHRRLRLHVLSGTDEVIAKLEGPGPHVIDKPKAGGIRRSDVGDNFGVAWSTDDGIRADEVSIAIGNSADTISKDDSGSNNDISMSLLPTAGDYNLTLTRTNRVTMSGGIEASVFSVSYSVETTFTLID